jgi:outer membrane protein assembly factor BamB
LKPDGTEKWRLHTGGATESSPALDGQGMIYLGANLFNIGVNEDGKKIWERGAADMIDASPVVTANRVVYCSSPWREFYAIQADGALQWHVLEDARVWSSPVIGSDGTIYTTSGYDLCAITFTNPMPSLAKSSWPMFRANPQHTGRVQK